MQTPKGRPPATPRQAGRALIQALLAIGLFTVVLGALGPTLDAHDEDRTPAVAQRRDLRDPVAFEQLATEHCRQAAGDNAGWIRTSNPREIACTDKHGRRQRNVITILHRSER